MQYRYGRWDALSAYLYDGNLLIDNNQIENSIRQLASAEKITFLQDHAKQHNGGP
jgi:transposase